MSQLIAFAIAPSRLHADLAVTRLQQAAGDVDALSLIYAPSATPNSIPCFFHAPAYVTVNAGRPVAVSGFLRDTFDAEERDFCDPFHSALLALGLSREHRSFIEDAAFERCPVIAVAISSLPEFLAICKIFQNAGMERVFASSVDVTAHDKHHSPDRGHVAHAA